MIDEEIKKEILSVLSEFAGEFVSPENGADIAFEAASPYYDGKCRVSVTGLESDYYGERGAWVVITAPRRPGLDESKIKFQYHKPDVLGHYVLCSNFRAKEE